MGDVNDPKWLRFKTIAAFLRKAVVDFPLNGDSETKVDEDWDERVVHHVNNWADANAVSSELSGSWDKGYHMVLLDLDIDHVYIPSSTPYHGHLILKTRLKQEAMQEVLEVLGKHGILQPGYVSAARHRKSAWLRVPWVKKTENWSFNEGQGYNPTTKEFF